MEERLFNKLLECQISLRTYGKQGADLGKLTAIFQKHLSSYQPDAVIKAINTHITSSPDFPTPYDIKMILDGTTGGRDKPNRLIYSYILDQRKQGNDYFGSDYKKQYEAFYMENKPWNEPIQDQKPPYQVEFDRVCDASQGLKKLGNNFLNVKKVTNFNQ